MSVIHTSPRDVATNPTDPGLPGGFNSSNFEDSYRPRRHSSDPFDTSDPDTEAAVDRANERERLRRANADAGALEAEIIGAMIEEVRKL